MNHVKNAFLIMAVVAVALAGCVCVAEESDATEAGFGTVTYNSMDGFSVHLDSYDTGYIAFVYGGTTYSGQVDSSGNATCVSASGSILPVGELTMRAMYGTTSGGATQLPNLALSIVEVVFNSNNGSDESQTVRYSVDTFELPQFGWSGADGGQFVGWATTATATEPDVDSENYAVPAGGATLYAVYNEAADTYPVNVDYDQDQGTVSVDPAEASEGDIVTITVLPNDTFVVGSVTVTIGGSAVQVTDCQDGTYTFIMGAGTAEVSVEFVSESPEGLTVSFDANYEGAPTIESQTVPYGGTATEPEAPEREGYTFLGWFTEDDVRYVFETPVTAPITLYAHWQVMTYGVTIDVSGNGQVTADKDSVDFGDDVVLTVAAWEGHFLSSLTVNGTDVTDQVTDDGTYTVGSVTGDVTVSAVFELLSYEVTFETNGGSPVESQTVGYNGVAVEPEAPVLEHYDFTGWYVDADCTEAYVFTISVTGPVTLYAGWTAHLYSVTWDADNGTGPFVQQLAYGTVLTAPEDPEKAASGDTYYQFHCWMNTATGAELAEGDTVTGDMGFRAHYTETVVFDGFSVSLDFGFGGNVVAVPSAEDPTTTVLTISPSFGFYMASLNVDPSSGATVVYIGNENGVLTYEIRDITADLTVKVMFMPIDSGDDDPVPNPPVVVPGNNGDDGNGTIIVAAVAAVLVIVFAAIYVIYGRKE